MHHYDVVLKTEHQALFLHNWALQEYNDSLDSVDLFPRTASLGMGLFIINTINHLIKLPFLSSG